MKIIHLSAENIKKLKVVDISPPQDMVQITGANGSGKSSVLDSIWWALSGTKNIPDMPIRQGEDKARITLKMGELVVSRKFSDKGSTLTIENAEGARFSSPQKMLDELIGELSFDPLEFSRMKPADQYEELKRIANIEIDIDALDQANAADYAQRTEVNRRAKEDRARASGYTFQHEPSAQPIDTADLLKQLERPGEHNARVDKQIQYLATTKDNVAAWKSEVEQMRQAIEEAESKIEAAEANLVKYATIPAKVDPTAIQNKIANAQAINDEFHKREEAKRLIEMAKKMEEESKAITARMDAREKQKVDAIAAAKMPVVGLSLSDKRVYLNSIPFDQASSAEQLRTSVAIAMAANPKLRVIRIKDGSLLDDAGMDMIGKMAKSQDYQIWIEKVDTTGKIGIVMEDGGVAATNKPILAA